MYKIQVIKGNAVNVTADAIVNSANNNLMPGSGLNKMLFYSAGNGLFDACMDIGYCETGKAVVTQGFNTPAKYIFHAVGPYWHGGYEGEARDLASCYVEIMKLAEANDCKSIVIPAICTGDAGYPLREAAEIATTTVKSYIRMHNLDIEVYFVCTDNDTVYEYRKAKDKNIDITKYIMRKNIKIEAVLTKEEKSYAKPALFAKELSEKQKSRLIKYVFDRITKTDYKDLIFLPYPTTKSDVNSSLCEKHGDKTGPYVTLDCISDFKIVKGVISFTITPCAYRFEDEFQNIIVTDEIDEQDIESTDYEVDYSATYESNFDIETALEMIDAPDLEQDNKKKIKNNYVEDGIVCDVEKLLCSLNVVEDASDKQNENIIKDDIINGDVFFEENVNEEIIDEEKFAYSNKHTDIITDANGNGYITKLPVGIYKNGVLVETIDYTLFEANCPDGIKKNRLPIGITVDIPNDSGLRIEEVLNLSNEYLYASIMFSNIDTSNKPNAISGSVFNLRDEYENVIPVTRMDNGEYHVDLNSENTDVITDESGNVKINGLKFGNYSVIQTKVADGYVSKNDIIKFSIDNSFFDDEQNVVLTDIGCFKNSCTTISISQIDAITKNILNGAEICLVDDNDEKISTWVSTDKNKIITHLVVGHQYKIMELNAPYAYELAESIVFEVGNTSDVQSFILSHNRLYGSIHITQKAEAFYASHLLASVNGQQLNSIEWRIRRLPGVIYELYATSDIIHPDGKTGIIYKAGELVKSLVTGRDGVANFTDVSFGEYFIKTSSTISGYVLPATTTSVIVKSDKAIKKIAYAIKQRLSLNINVQSTVGDPVVGAMYGLYTAENIKNVDQKITLLSDNLIGITTTDSRGIASFNECVPIGKYYIKEINKADGYLLSKERMDIDYSLNNKGMLEHKPTADFNFTTLNEPITLTINAIDQDDTESIVPDTEMLLVKNRKVVRIWKTKSEPTVLYAVPAGKYALLVKCAPKGYAKPMMSEIEVKEISDVQKYQVEMPRQMLTLKVNTKIANTETGIENMNYIIKSNNDNINICKTKKKSFLASLFFGK